MIHDYYIRTNTQQELYDTLTAIGFKQDGDNFYFEEPSVDVLLNIIGDLPKQHHDGTIMSSVTGVDENGEPIIEYDMHGKFHANIRTTGIINGLNNQVFPTHPLRKFL